jgi:hypothetical protein
VVTLRLINLIISSPRKISKIDRRARMEEPRVLQVPESTWSVVHMDWVTGLPKSPEGYDDI